jgi:hypothetical protein
MNERAIKKGKHTFRDGKENGNQLTKIYLSWYYIGMNDLHFACPQIAFSFWLTNYR